MIKSFILASILLIPSFVFSQNIPADTAAIRVPEYAQLKEESISAKNLTGNQHNLVDVLFLYSPNTESLFSSFNDLEDKVNVIVDRANLIFRNSQIRMRIRSVGLIPSPIEEANDAESELPSITNSSEVQNLREEFQADIVSFLVSHTSNNKHCGLAYQLEAINEFAQNFGYQIVSLHPVCEDWVLAHELGHNLGAQHDIENSPNPGLFEYSHGLRINSNGSEYRTVMAFYPGSVISYFSSPNLSYQGVSLGNKDADNTKTLEASRDFVANYRGESIIEIIPEVDFSRTIDTKNCQFVASFKNFAGDTSVNFYTRTKKKSRLVKSQEIDETSVLIKVKRSEQTKFLRAEMKDSAGEYISSETKCRAKK